MGVLTPILALLLLCLLAGRRGADWRRAWLAGATAWAACLVVITEVLSLSQAITRPGLLIGWSLVIALALGSHLALSRRGVVWPRPPRVSRSPAVMLALNTLPFILGSAALC